jgi:hypothetical protein
MAALDYTRTQWRWALHMPGCFRVNERDQDQDASRDDVWREPPGYLGEAVRRAKLIPSRAGRSEPWPQTEGLPRL